MASLLKDGRVVSLEPGCWYKELVDGKWAEPSSSFSFDDIWEGRELSDKELRSYMEGSGSPN